MREVTYAAYYSIAETFLSHSKPDTDSFVMKYM